MEIKRSTTNSPCHPPRKQGDPVTQALRSTGSPAFERGKHSQTPQTGVIPCSQGVLQGVFFGSPCDQVIRMQLYATAAMI